MFVITGVRYKQVNLCTKMTNLTLNYVRYNKVFVTIRDYDDRVSLYFQCRQELTVIIAFESFRNKNFIFNSVLRAFTFSWWMSIWSTYICLTFLLMIPGNILDIHSGNKSLTFILFVLQMKGLHQCFSTGVPKNLEIYWKVSINSTFFVLF